MTILVGESYAPEFQKYFQEQILNAMKLDHKGNNQLFRIILPNAEYILKKYSDWHRDDWERGKSEFTAMTHLWNTGFREIPKPIHFDEKQNIAVYSYEKGKILNSQEVRRKDISKAVKFLVKLGKLETKDKKIFSPTSAACLNLIGYVDIIDRRLDTMKDYEPNSFIGEKAKFFLVNQVYPKVEELKSVFFGKTKNFNIKSKLPLEEQVLSPGDFGFHNILVNGKDYKFIDFEYFGRDDPARQILGFIHHDKSFKISSRIISCLPLDSFFFCRFF